MNSTATTINGDWLSKGSMYILLVSWSNWYNSGYWRSNDSPWLPIVLAQRLYSFPAACKLNELAEAAAAQMISSKSRVSTLDQVGKGEVVCVCGCGCIYEDVNQMFAGGRLIEKQRRTWERLGSWGKTGKATFQYLCVCIWSCGRIRWCMHIYIYIYIYMCSEYAHKQKERVGISQWDGKRI